MSKKNARQQLEKEKGQALEPSTSCWNLNFLGLAQGLLFRPSRSTKVEGSCHQNANDHLNIWCLLSKHFLLDSSNWIFLTFQGIRRHIKLLAEVWKDLEQETPPSLGIQNFGAVAVDLIDHLEQETKNHGWFESFHFPALGDERCNSSDVFLVPIRPKITQRMFQTYHPTESVLFRQLISLQYTQLKIKNQKSITNLK